MGDAIPTKSGRPVVALIMAAGRGIRAGGVIPKQYREIAGRPVLAWTLDRFIADPCVDVVAAVVSKEDRSRYAAAVPVHPKLLAPVEGGATRQESVRLGLESLTEIAPFAVLIHDAVRPFVPARVIGEVARALTDHQAVLPGHAVVDTLQRMDAEGYVIGPQDRTALIAAETPQGFRFDAIRAAHARAREAGIDFTDDAAVAAFAGIRVKVVPGGGRDNPKLTTPEDLVMAENRLSSMAERGETRVGTGYDVHRLGPGAGVMLGGLRIPCAFALIGHSDADVALHALTDAVLGALGEGDIGAHFPPSDVSLRGVSSDRFLAFAVARVAARGGRILHLDLSLIAEAPKIGPHREAMRTRIAAIAGITVDRMAVKATTNEHLGFVGRGEGIAALATATVSLPSSR